jgi:hypothetical protein
MHHRGREVLGNAIYDNILLQRVHARSTGRPEEIAVNCLPVLKRCELHHEHHSDYLTQHRQVHAQSLLALAVGSQPHLGQPL